MALPCSGPLSISQIHTELGSSSYSLHALSVAAGKGTPDAISEFYCYSNRSITFSSLTSIGYTGSISGTVTITGATATFSGYSTLYGTGRLSTNITVGGTSRATIRSSAGTTTSTTFTLAPGTYSYYFDVTVTSGSGSGGINAYFV